MTDPWQHLRRLTPARIALGRAGGSLPTAEVLKFSTDHALARDAVHAELDVNRLRTDLADLGLPILSVRTQACDRAVYLQRPDLGRRLADDAERDLVAGDRTGSHAGVDLAIVVADGLSALAAQKQSPALLRELLPLLKSSGLTIGPIVIARQARVASQDEIGRLMRARCALMLIGERPGLGTPDSLGAYLVFDPKPGNTDADRNCVSNIRPEGLPPAVAAATLHYLIGQAIGRQISGVQLKDERQLTAPLPPQTSALNTPRRLCKTNFPVTPGR